MSSQLFYSFEGSGMPMRILATFLFALLTAGAALGQASRKVQAGDFKTSASCKPCHQEIHEQWTSSTHSNAYRDPIYQVFLRRVDEQSQGRLTQFCVSCHAPLATLTKTVPAKLFDGQPKPALLEEGVSCEFCHTISGSEVEFRGTSLGALLFPRSGQTETLYGRHADASTAAHPTKPSKFLLSSELCGTCHRFGHPVSGLPIQDTYAEWKNSPYAKEGKRCQDCHMPAYAGRAAAGGKERPELHAHVFLGGHTDMIRKAATIQIKSSWKGPSKESLQVAVSVANVGAGHYIPTGIPGIREMFLEVSALKGSQTIATEKRPLALELFDPEGNPAMPWDAVRFGKDTRIGPKKTRVEQFSFKLAGRAEVRVEAKLLERLVSEQAAKYAGVPAAPAMPMAEAVAAAP
jgi:nitrate/TMAO reductase-like tetraheme cytochrome c subunit